MKSRNDTIDRILELEKEKLHLIFSLMPFVYAKNEENILFQHIEKLDLMRRTEYCLKAENICFIGDIVCNPSLKKDAFPGRAWLVNCFKIPNFGKKSLNDLQLQLAKNGIVDYVDYPLYLEERQKITNESYDFTLF